MALSFPDCGLQRIQERAWGTKTNGNVVLRLYVNDYTPVAGSVAGSFTEMSTLSYAAKTLTAASWSVSVVSSKGEATYAQQVWTFTAGTAVPVYGYYVTDSSDGVLIYAERFTSPTTMQYAGDQIKVTLLNDEARA